MSLVFGDTFYFMALLNQRDAAHGLAIHFSERFRGQLVTTEAVLVETADALSSTRHRGAVAAYLSHLWIAPNIEVVATSTSLLKGGLGLFRERADKDWSSPTASRSSSCASAGSPMRSRATTILSRPASIHF
jgi:uncharacterized protein